MLLDDIDFISIGTIFSRDLHFALYFSDIMQSSTHINGSKYRKMYHRVSNIFPDNYKCKMLIY